MPLKKVTGLMDEFKATNSISQILWTLGNNTRSFVSLPHVNVNSVAQMRLAIPTSIRLCLAVG